MNNSHEIYCLFVYLFLTKLKPETEGSVKEKETQTFSCYLATLPVMRMFY